ncbi:MAG: hypothetical protein J6X14_00870 [Lachnospiraceae bacterium]|nr:hypothetical protein [Lachnospiraceae bacterium]MBP5668845.1 hypothetical protein [Lachnospiraceae bacterium]
MEKRKRELLDIVGEDPKAAQLVDEIAFLEVQLRELKKLPFLNVNPKNPMQQKATPAAKQYKELLQQYNNSLRLLFHLSGDLGGDQEEESPLRAWLRSREEKTNAGNGKKDLDA